MRALKMRPWLILGGATLVVGLLFIARRTPEDRIQQTVAPLVRVAIAKAVPYQFSVTAHGSVSPRVESDLIPQVSGELVWVAPSLAAGGFFERGDVLARIDPADYRVDRETARAIVARTTSEHGRAEKELERQRSLASQSVTSESRIDDAENAFRIALASLREAQARLERAERDLTRAELTAPYRGRVRSEQVDVGQFVTRGAPIAKLYAVDFAEVRLPVPDRELAYLDVPLVSQIGSGAEGDSGGDSGVDSEVENAAGSRVTLVAEFAGQRHQWEGRLVRTEAELDPRSRMVHLVARVKDPYRLETDAGSERTAPLAVGLFVEATIEGRALDQAFVIPRDALREGHQVYVVDEQDQIHFREVEVLRTQRDDVILGAGLKAGDRICISPLAAVINGMQVRVVEVPASKPLAEHSSEPDQAMR